MNTLTETLGRIVVDDYVYLSECNRDLDDEVRQLEELQYALQRLPPEDKAAFVALIERVAAEETDEKRRQVILSLPTAAGLVEEPPEGGALRKAS